MSYDSSEDTKKHRANIMQVYFELNSEMNDRIIHHDLSKLHEPEKSGYDELVPRLRATKFGTPEYYEARDAMAEITSHHYKENRHHPEHFENGYHDMNLLDFMEHIMDCYAASLCSDTSFPEGIKTVLERNGAPDVLIDMVLNTYEDILKDIKPDEK